MTTTASCHRPHCGRAAHGAAPGQVLRGERYRGHLMMKPRAVVAAGMATLLAAALVGCASGTGSSNADTGRASAGFVPLHGLDEQVLEPGRYLARVAGGVNHPLLPVLTVPGGFRPVPDGIGVVSGDNDEDSRVIWVWDIGSVYSHPCRAGKVAKAVGPTVADLADAFVSQPLRDATKPVPVTVDGHDGLYVELSVPDGIDVTKCAGGRFDSWVEEGNDGGRWQQIGGQTDKLWILDVDGDRITIAGTHGPATNADEAQELEDIIRTATFVPADSC